MGDKPRITADPLLYTRQGDSTVLKPQAQPLDSFVRPAEPIASSWHDVAKSLAEVRPGLNKYIEEKANHISAEDARKAEADGMISTATSWDDAIKKGEVSAGASPLYQRVYEETIGKLNATNVAQATLWQKWMAPENEIRSTQDPAVIGKWFADQRKGFVDGKSADFSAGFMPSFNGVQQQLTQRIISDNVKELEGKNHDALGQLMTDTILANRNLSPQQIAEKLASDGLPQRFAGMQGKEVNTVMAKAIIATATKLNDPRLLQIGYADRPDVKNPGQVIRGVFTIPDFASAATTAQTQMESRSYTNAARADHQSNVANKKASADTRIAILNDQLKNRDDPAWEPDPALLAKGVAADPNFASQIKAQTEALKKVVRPPNVTVSTALMIDLSTKAASGQNITGELLSASTSGNLSQPQIDTLIKTQTSAASDTSVLKHPAYAMWDAKIKSAVDPLVSKLDAAQSARLGGLAQSSFLRSALDFEDQRRKENRPMNEGDLSAYLDKTAQDILKRLNLATASQDPGGAPASLLDTKVPLPATPVAPASPAVPGKGAAVGPKFSPVKAGFVLPAEALSAGTNPDGSFNESDWKPTEVAIRDLSAGDLLSRFRAEPDRASPDGRPLWKVIDDKYGKGASAFLLKQDDSALAVFAPKPKKK